MHRVKRYAIPFLIAVLVMILVPAAALAEEPAPVPDDASVSESLSVSEDAPTSEDAPASEDVPLSEDAPAADDVPVITEIALHGIGWPIPGNEPTPPVGEIRDIPAFASAYTGPANDPIQIGNPFIDGFIDWFTVKNAVHYFPEVFQEETVYTAEISLHVNPEMANLGNYYDEIRVILDWKLPDSEEPEIYADKRYGQDGSLEIGITIIYPPTKRAPGADLTPALEYADTYSLAPVRPSYVWSAYNISCPRLAVQLMGPEPLDSISYAWFGEDENQVSGADLNSFVPSRRMLGTEYALKTFYVNAHGTRNGEDISFETVSIPVMVCPADGVTVLPNTTLNSDGTWNPFYYVEGHTLTPWLEVSFLGALSGDEITYTWTNEYGDVVSYDSVYSPSAFVYSRGERKFWCSVTVTRDGVPLPIYNNPVEFTVFIYNDYLTVSGPYAVEPGSLVDIEISNHGVDGFTGTVEVDGLEIVSISPNAQFCDTEKVVLGSDIGGLSATYTCRVTKPAGDKVSFTVKDTMISVPWGDYDSGSSTWSVWVVADREDVWGPFYDADSYETRIHSYASPEDLYIVDEYSLTFRADLAGPYAVKNPQFEWYIDDTATPVPGVSGNVLDADSKLLGTKYALKTITVTATATSARNGEKVTFAPASFTVRVTPSNGLTLIPWSSNNSVLKKQVHEYVAGLSPSEPTLEAYTVGIGPYDNCNFEWTDEYGNVVGHGTYFTPSAEQLGDEACEKIFRCSLFSEYNGQPVAVYNSPVEFIVEVGVNDLSVTGPESVQTGSTIDVYAGAPGLFGLAGTVSTKGLRVTGVSNEMSDHDRLILAGGGDKMTAVYTCEVTAKPGETVEFSVHDIRVSAGTEDVLVDDNISWSAPVVAASAPSETPTPPTVPPVNPPGPGTSGGGSVNPPADYPDPVPSPSPSPTPEPVPSPSPSEEPDAPVELLPSAPSGIKVEDDPDGTGTIITGVPMSTTNDEFTIADLKALIQVPEGGRVQILDADGWPALPYARAATGMVVEVFDADGVPVAQSTVVVPGDVLGTGASSLSQIVTMAKAFTGDLQLEGPYALAADLDGSGGITLTDLVKAAIMFVDALKIA